MCQAWQLTTATQIHVKNLPNVFCHLQNAHSWNEIRTTPRFSCCVTNLKKNVTQHETQHKINSNMHNMINCWEDIYLIVLCLYSCHTIIKHMPNEHYTHHVHCSRKHCAIHIANCTQCAINICARKLCQFSAPIFNNNALLYQPLKTANRNLHIFHLKVPTSNWWFSTMIPTKWATSNICHSFFSLNILY